MKFINIQNTYPDIMSTRGRSGTGATFKLEPFLITVNAWLLTIVTKSSILDVAAVLDPPLSTIIKLKQNTYNLTNFHIFESQNLKKKRSVYMTLHIELCPILNYAMTQNKPKPPKTTQNIAKQAIASQKQTENESKWPKTTQNNPKPAKRRPETKNQAKTSQRRLTMTQNDPKPKTSQNQPKGDLKSTQNDPRRSKTRKTAKSRP